MRLAGIFVSIIALSVCTDAACQGNVKRITLCGVELTVPQTLKLVAPETDDCTYSTYSPDGQISIYDLPIDRYINSEFSKYMVESGQPKLTYPPTVKDDRYFYYASRKRYRLKRFNERDGSYYGIRPVAYTDELGDQNIARQVFCVDLLENRQGKTVDYGFCFKSEKAAKEYLSNVEAQHETRGIVRDAEGRP